MKSFGLNTELDPPRVVFHVLLLVWDRPVWGVERTVVLVGDSQALPPAMRNMMRYGHRTFKQILSLVGMVLCVYENNTNLNFCSGGQEYELDRAVDAI